MSRICVDHALPRREKFTSWSRVLLQRRKLFCYRVMYEAGAARMDTVKDTVFSGHQHGVPLNLDLLPLSNLTINLDGILSQKKESSTFYFL
jgi:hypothetical protein